MKKILGIIMAAGLFGGIVFAAQQTLDDQDATKVGLPSLVTKCNANFTELYAGTAQTLASNKVFIGSALNLAYGRTLSGLFTINTNGVASATTSGAAVTNATVAITPQAPSAHTPTITVTPETGAVTAEGANDLVTPTATMTPETGAITASGANDLATITATMTFQTTVAYDSTGAPLTNAAGDNILFVTNGTCAITPDVPTNAVVAITVTGGDAVWTNATCAITPDLASNTVVVVTVTGGDAVWTNATAASSALPLFATNATAAVTKETATFVKP